MKTRTFLLSLALSLPFLASAATKAEADILAIRAHEAYASGKYAEALALYDSVANDYSSTTLFYNIGNCHFKLGDVPHAILNYERALRLSPGDEDVQANLDLARRQVADRVNELPTFTLGSTWGRLRGGKDADQWSRRSLWACLGFFIILAVAVAVRQRMLKRVLFGASALALMFTLLAVSFAAVRHAEITDDSEAIIMTPKVDVRSEPRDGTTVLFVLHKGTKVSVLQEQGGWYEVKLPNGSVGWMPPASLERI